MKQKGITLRKFVETCSLKSFTKIENPLPDVKEMDWKDAFSLFKKCYVEYREALTVSDDKIYYCFETFHLTRIGNRIFKKRDENSQYIYITPTIVNIGKTTQSHFVFKFLSLLGIDWYRDIPKQIVSGFFMKKAILRAIITKKIYSEETFYRFIASRCYGLKEINWKSIKKYCEMCFVNHVFISILDMKSFTKDVEKSIEVITKTNNYTLYYDLLKCAVELGQVVDFSWSLNRIREEHQKQIDIINIEKLASKKQDPIYKQLIETEYIKVLNTERDVYLESSKMHHCLYSCYYKSMLNKTFMAFHMSYPEDCTFSIRYINDGISFDQVHLAYNKPVQKETKAIVDNFLKNNEKTLLNIFRTEKPEYIREEITDLPLWNDLAF